MSTQDNAQHSKHYPPPEALERSAHVAGLNHRASTEFGSDS